MLHGSWDDPVCCAFPEYLRRRTAMTILDPRTGLTVTVETRPRP
jgi:hypothetical protein